MPPIAKLSPLFEPQEIALAVGIAALLAIAVLVLLRALNGWRPLGTGEPRPPRVRRSSRGLIGGTIRLFGWLVILLVVVFLVTAALAGVYPAIVLLVVGILVAQRYRAARQRTMLATLAVASERGIPLPSALRALAAGRWGSAARRLRQVAADLEYGESLPDALAAAGGLIPPQAMLKVRLGQQVGALPEALREAGVMDAVADSARGQLAAKLVYLTVVGFFMLQVGIFMMWKIAPSFEKIFKDFGTTMPSISREVIWVSHATLNYGFLWILPVSFLLLYVLAWAVAGFDANFLVLRGLAARLDRAAVFESLALVTGRQRPMTQGILSLATYYPKDWVRRRLSRAFTAIHAGGSWMDALRAQRLMGAADAAVLAAAQRAGNLPWALREVAESNRRRFTYRLYIFMQVAFPLAILSVGAAVGVFVAAFFLPLVALIQRMS